MITYDTPLDRAKALRDEFVAFADAQEYGLPASRYVQIGDVVRDCEAVIVAVGSLAPDPFYDPVTCVSPRSATFLVEIIRNCAVAYNQHGLTVPATLETISERGSADGQLLYEFAEQIDGWTSKQAWSVQWALTEGRLQVASLQITIGIP